MATIVTEQSNPKNQINPNTCKFFICMPTTVVTPEDLEKLKTELIEEIGKLVTRQYTTPARKWLKSHEVRRLLTVSPGTLQNLRINGTLPFTKIGGVIFYDYEDIRKMLEDNKRNPHRMPFRR